MWPSVLQVVELLPELSMTVVQLTHNLHIWYDRMAAAIEASTSKSAAEKEAEKVTCHTLPHIWLSYSAPLLDNPSTGLQSNRRLVDRALWGQSAQL